MEEYKLYRAIDIDGSAVVMAILTDVLADSAPAEYFHPDAQDVEEAGSIEISGDVTELGQSFRVSEC